MLYATCISCSLEGDAIAVKWILIRVICCLCCAFPQGERLIGVLLIVHVLEDQVVLVRVELLEEMSMAVCWVPYDPSIGIACFRPQVELLSESVLRRHQNPQLRLLPSVLRPLQ